jgi:hypothetical protein
MYVTEMGKMICAWTGAHYRIEILRKGTIRWSRGDPSANSGDVGILPGQSLSQVFLDDLISRRDTTSSRCQIRLLQPSATEILVQYLQGCFRSKSGHPICYCTGKYAEYDGLQALQLDRLPSVMVGNLPHDMPPWLRCAL